MNKRITITLRLSKELCEKVDKSAKLNHRSRNNEIINLVTDGLTQETNNNKSKKENKGKIQYKVNNHERV